MNNTKTRLPLKISLKIGAGRFFDRLLTLRDKPNSIRVLVYHKITDDYVPDEWLQMTTPRVLFRRQMRYLKENDYNTIFAEDVSPLLSSAKGLPLRTIAITFDDGYKDNYRNALPILKEYGLKGTIFVTVDFINKGPSRADTYLSWDEISEMKKSGLFSFGCHSLSHKNLAVLKKDELDKEIRGAKEALEEGLNSEVPVFAYPYGWHSSFNNKVIDALRRNCFSSAFTGIYGVNTKNTGPFRLKRLRISWLDDTDGLGMILRGAYDWYGLYQGAVSLWQTP